MSSRLALGSLVALACVVLVWFALAREPGSVREGAAHPAREPGVPHLDGIAAEPDPPPSPRPARESLPSVAAPAGVAEPAPERAVGALFAVLSGRVLDSAHTPVAGAQVAVRRPQVGHFSVLDLEVRRHPREVARAVTGADGRFSFELERGIPFDLAISAADFCEELLTQRHAGEELEVVLTSGFLVHGVVTRTRDGGPIADARVRVFQLNHAAGGERVTTTAGDGSYSLRITFQEDATLEVTPRREMSSAWIGLALGADGTMRCDVALSDGIEVRGKVVAAGGGQPIEGAEVGEGWTYRRKTSTDARGDYVLSGFGASGVQELYARAPGFGQAQRANLPPIVDGVLRVDFELPRGRIVRGRVLDADGRPLADAYVAAVASEDGPEGQRTDWVSGKSAAGGRFELGGLRPELRHCLVVSADGFATQVYDFPEHELEELELELEDVRLTPPAVLAGVVADENGQALGGMEVILGGANRDRGLWRRASALGPAGEWYVDSRRTRADLHGRFWFGALPAGDFRLYARASGRPASPTVQLALEEGERREGFVLLYPHGEAIRGTVVDAEGNGLGGVYVNATLRRARSGRAGEHERGRATCRTEVNGVFELGGLPPGVYELQLHPYELASDPDLPWLATTLEVESGAEPLRIVLPRGLSIRGRLVDAAGSALVGYTILARSTVGSDSVSSASGDDGSFVLEVEASTLWELEVRGAWQTEAFDEILHTEPGVPAGTRELLLRIQAGAR